MQLTNIVAAIMAFTSLAIAMPVNSIRGVPNTDNVIPDPNAIAGSPPNGATRALHILPRGVPNTDNVIPDPNAIAGAPPNQGVARAVLNTDNVIPDPNAIAGAPPTTVS